jgi:membrane protein
MNRRTFLALVKTSFQEWQVDNVNLRAGALAFFIILPLPSLLLIATTVFVQLFGQSRAISMLIGEVRVVVGPTVASIVRDILESSGGLSFSWTAFVFNIVFSFLGVIGIFAVLRDTMNFIWGVQSPKQQSLISRVRRSIVPFLQILPLGFSLVIWTTVSVVLFNYLGTTLEPLTGNLTPLILRIVQIVLSFILATLLFVLIFMNVPDVKIQWRDVRFAAVMTAVVYSVGNLLFGLYVQAFSATVAGVTGSLILLLLWIFLFNQFLFFGAEFSKAYATSEGSLAELQRPEPI